MIEGLKPYAEYRDSGLPWVGKIPAHWSGNRLRHACEMLVSNVDKHTKASEVPVRLCNYVDVYRNERIHPRLRFMRATASKDEAERFRLRKGDVVITKDSEIWTDIGVPSLVEYEAPDLVCGYHLAILRPRPDFVVGGFLHRVLRSQPVAAQFHVEAHGVTRYGLSHGAIKDVSIPIPPPDEQAAIVRFLDHANRKIDGFIRAKRKLIGLLSEQKQVIIHQAVTRGLNPDVPLKPSGIPWLGDIPEHWESRPLKQTLLRMDYGTSESSTSDGKFRVLTMGHIQDGRVLIPESGGIDDIPAGLSLRTNDLLFNRTNSPELVGKVGIFTGGVEPPVTFASYLVRLRARPEHSPHWLNYILNSLRFLAYARSQALVSLHQANLNSSRYGRMSIPVPPPAEQDSIAQQIKEQTGTIDTAITRTEREIALVQEYRTRLTADVVTGKLDVREAAAKLPDLPAEPVAEPATDEALEDAETEEV